MLVYIVIYTVLCAHVSYTFNPVKSNYMGEKLSVTFQMMFQYKQ